jgi:hypothetical protein
MELEPLEETQGRQRRHCLGTLISHADRVDHHGIIRWPVCVESRVSELASVSSAAHRCPSRYDICFADASLTLVWLQAKHRKLRIIVNHSFDSFILQLHHYTIKIGVTCVILSHTVTVIQPSMEFPRMGKVGRCVRW